MWTLACVCVCAVRGAEIFVKHLLHFLVIRRDVNSDVFSTGSSSPGALAASSNNVRVPSTRRVVTPLCYRVLEV